MKENYSMPMPPLDELPYKNIREDWSSLSFDLYVVRMAQLYWNAWPKTEEIWSGFKYNNNAWGLISEPYSWIILPDKRIDKVWTKDLSIEIQNFEPGNTYKDYLLFNFPIDNDDTDKKFEREFDEGEFSIFPTSNLLFTVYAHESFHGFQGAWKYPGSLPELSTPDIVPIHEKNPTARKLKLELYKCIRQAILDPDNQKEHLGLAKYWQNRYDTENPEESHLLHISGLTEGSARYFDIAITCRALFGFESSKEVIESAYSLLVEKYCTVSKMEDNSVLELYNISGLCGILLEIQNDKGWQERVEKGERIEDILLENIEISSPS